MMRVTDLRKTHPGAAGPTLDGVSLVVEASGIVAILGKSGAGKSFAKPAGKPAWQGK